MATSKICSISGCEKPRHTRGYCSGHHSRWKTHGDPLGGYRRAASGEPLRWIADHAADDENDARECLIWPFSKHSHGYGHVLSGGRRQLAHRVMCEAAHGPPPSDKHEAAHSCGRGPLGCVHPQHLRRATPRENKADSIAHGTWVHGESCPNSKLTTPEVRAIRARCAAGDMQRDVAKDYGIGSDHISRIVSRQAWGWLD